MKLDRLRDAEEVAQHGARAAAEIAREAIAQRGAFAVALAGGDTPRRMYERLSTDAAVDWSRAEFFFGDERPVGPDHAESNYRMARAALLDPLGVDPQRVHRIQGERPDLDAAARDYEREIARTLGADPADAPPPLDLVLLGMGADGHTASLFPHTAALSEARRWVVANDVPAHSTRRITITFPVIERARFVLVLVTGASKAAALAEVLEGPVDLQRLPSQRLRTCEGRVEWIVDAVAASRIRGDPAR